MCSHRGGCHCVVQNLAAAGALEATPFTSDSGVAIEPTFSPDGESIAYVWNGPGEDNSDIYVKAASGGAPFRLTDNAAQDYSPTWSPDGRSIAILRSVGINHAEVRVVPASGGTERKLLRSAHHNGGRGGSLVRFSGGRLLGAGW